MTKAVNQLVCQSVKHQGAMKVEKKKLLRHGLNCVTNYWFLVLKLAAIPFVAYCVVYVQVTILQYTVKIVEDIFVSDVPVLYMLFQPAIWMVRYGVVTSHDVYIMYVICRKMFMFSSLCHHVHCSPEITNFTLHTAMK